MILLDTSVAIEIREEAVASPRFERLPKELALSVFTWIELEGGAQAEPEYARLRRRRLDAMLETMTIVRFDPAVIPVYGRIVAALSFSRRQILDRLIAATAIAHDLTLVTLNEADFRNIPDLRLEVWPAQ